MISKVSLIADRTGFVSDYEFIGGSATNGFVNMETNSMQMITGTLRSHFGESSVFYLSNYYIIIRRFYSNIRTWRLLDLTLQLAHMRSFV